jgi:hypothetical protein
MTSRSVRLLAVGFAVVSSSSLLPRGATAQQPATVVTPALDFSGVIYGNYQYFTDSARRAANGGNRPNKFDIERVYLNFRMPVGDNAGIRVTTDVFNNTNTAANAYYQGWAIRLKYALIEYTMAKNSMGPGSNVKVRVGMMPNSFIDYEEGFWPRWLGTTVTDRLGYFPSSDIGLGGIATLPNHLGEIYGQVVNGSGYGSYETNSFKDFTLRAAFTPFGKDSGLIKTFAITPWVYIGENASKFATGGVGQVGPVTDGLVRNRYGIFVGLRDRRLTGGIDFTPRKDASENGSNTVASPRVEIDSTGRATSLYAIVRPLEWANPKKHSSWAVVARWDHFTPNTSPTAAAYAGTTPAYNYTVLGTFWDVTPRTSFSIDWQQQSPSGYPEPFPAALKVTPTQSTIFVHWQASF